MPTLAEKKTFYTVTTGLEDDTDDTNPGVNGAAKREPTWRPQWLRPAVLAAFAGLFLCITIALPVALWYSQRHDGLTRTRQSYGYVWRFGPTAVLTVLAALWGRVELQAMRYMPWIVMRRGQAPDHDLDYTAMLSPEVLYHSLRRRHYLVFWTAITALLIRAEIVLAPGLFRLAPVEVVNPVQVRTLDTFNSSFTSTSTLTREAIIAYYAARAIKDFDMRYPYGVTKDAAYQTFGAGGARGTQSAPIKAEVDGFFTDMECVRMRNHVLDSVEGKGGPYGYKTRISMQFEGCDETVWIEQTSIEAPEEGEFRPSWMVGTRIGPVPRPCPNLPQQYPQMIYSAGNYSLGVLNTSRPIVLEPDFKAVLCAPTAWIAKVEVVDDGVSPNLTVLEGQPRREIDADINKMLEGSIPPTPGGGWFIDQSKLANYGPIMVENYSFNTTWDDSADLMERMSNATVRLMRRIGPLLGHYLLRTEADAGLVGEVTVTVDRLSLNRQVCMAMFALSFIISGLMLSALIRSRRYTRIWHRDPATILGSLLFVHDRSGSGLSEEMPAFELEGRKKSWSHSSFYPVVLRTWSQVTFTIFVGGLMIGLGVALRSSQLHGGIATVDESGFWYLLWTSFPALVMLGVSLYVASSDTMLRGLSELHSLTIAPCSARILDSSMLDMLGLRAMLRSVRQRLWTIVASQVLVLLCGFLATLATVAFSVTTIPEPTPVRLPQTTWFGDVAFGNDSYPYEKNREMLRSLIARKGEANFTSPRNTYNDLAFPVIDTSALAGDGAAAAAAAEGSRTVRARLPAAKIVSQCKMMPSSHWNVSITQSETIYRGTLLANETCPNNRTKPLTMAANMQFGRNQTGTSAGFSAFADVLNSPENLYYTNRLCGQGVTRAEDLLQPAFTQTYMWGRMSHDLADFVYLRYYKCTYSWAQVMADVNLVWLDGELVVDHNRPPVADMSTAKPYEPALKVPMYDWRTVTTGLGSGRLVGNAMPEITVTNTSAGDVHAFFRPLAEPYGDVPLDAFGDPAWDERILEGLNEVFAFTSAQLLNLESRVPAGRDSLTARYPGDVEADAVVVDASRRRLVQSATVTYVVIGILGVVALTHTWSLLSRALRAFFGIGLTSRLLSMNVEGLAPDEFGSINAMASLLYDSNLVGRLPDDSRRFTTEEVHAMLKGLRFRMGWFRREGDGERRFTVGALGDSAFEFLGGRYDGSDGYKRVSEGTDTEYQGGQGMREGNWI
ncbi:hypothetical protein CMUS01_08651 [Colletotrichum musicola]|uniref:Uncharacterized protein n=1 Tax=Colletotrichum musicola TaxID=2175873 RepID=A0A8H6KC40_9PEZI|nr:hypothetical protein CMUS01_08651 [Colletotrichum musicola]